MPIEDLKFNIGDSGAYIFATYHPIKITSSEKIDFDEFQEKINSLNQKTGNNFIATYEHGHGCRVFLDDSDDPEEFLNNKSFVVISEKEILYISDYNLWLIKFKKT